MSSISSLSPQPPAPPPPAPAKDAQVSKKADDSVKAAGAKTDALAATAVAAQTVKATGKVLDIQV